jgi:hypothetical protein
VEFAVTSAGTGPIDLEFFWLEEDEDGGILSFIAIDGEQFACYDASCRPPTSGGTGGSSPSKVGRVATRVGNKGTIDHSSTGLGLSELSPDNVEAQVQRLKDKGVIPGDFTTKETIDWIKTNIRTVYDKLTPEERAAWKEWYPAANRIGADAARDYGTTHSGANGVIAALSPGTDWDMNVAQARSLMKTLRDDTPLDAASAERANALSQESWARQVAAYEKKNAKAASDLADLQGKRAQATDPKEIKDLDKKITAKQRIVDQQIPPQPALDRFKVGDRPSQFPANEVGYLARGIEPNPEVRRIKVNPDATYDDSEISMTGGKNPRPVKGAWQSYENIGKAVEIYRNPDTETISTALGGAHKVRNFFNNIEDPNNTAGDVTIDTHAYGIGLANPVSVNHPLIAAGGGSIASSPGHAGDGTTGTYSLFAEAYKQVANEVGLLPRELQSVTWEKWRQLHPRTTRGRE